MIIKLKLDEMLAIARIALNQEILGYRAILSKLVFSMLDIQEFAHIIEQFEEIQKNVCSVKQSYALKEKELIDHHVDRESNEFKKSFQELKENFVKDINKVNSDIIAEFNENLKNSKEYEFEVGPLFSKAIKNSVESEKTMNELQIDSFIANALIRIYSKI